MEIKEGMYVRTEEEISKIEWITFQQWEGLDNTIEARFKLENKENLRYPQDNFKVSENLIDLIQVGDYVNGEKVTSTEPVDKNDTDRYLGFGDYDYYIHTSKDIKDVVTKEQFESMKYVVERDD